MRIKQATKRKIKKAIKNFSLELLDWLNELGQLIPEPFEGKQAYQRRLKSRFRHYPQAKVSQGIYRLKRQGLIKIKRLAGYTVYPLTLDGHRRLLIEKVRLNKFNPKDGTSCIVIFDIPEEKAKYRKFVRRLLVKNGFINLQRSVMIGPQFLPRQFYELMADLKIRPNVTMIKGKVLYS